MMFKISSEKIEEFIEKQHSIDGMVSVHDFELWLEEQPRVGEWIPCGKDNMPEDNVPVNVTWVNRRPASYYEDIKDKPFTATAVYYKGKWYWWDAVVEDRIAEHGDLGAKPIDIWIDVTAWMPLPPAYKEGE